MTIKPDLNGHIALVTGGSRGIGAAVAAALAEAGAAVAVNYRERVGEAEAVVAKIKGAGGRAVAVAADVSRSDAVAAMVEQVGAALGPVDILVNNAGMAIVRGIDELTESEFDQTIAVNLKSAFLCSCRRCAPTNGAASSTSPRERRAAPARSACTTTPPRRPWRA
jgi:3-oxoacyl-[acyl-carrier protein] reductase